MEDERWRVGVGLDLRDRGAQRRGHVRVGRFVEPDMAVADLHEPQRAATVHHPHCTARRLPERRSAQHAVRERPHGARPYPRHALQEIPSIELFVIECHSCPPHHLRENARPTRAWRRLISAIRRCRPRGGRSYSRRKATAPVWSCTVPVRMTPPAAVRPRRVSKRQRDCDKHLPAREANRQPGAPTMNKP